MNEENSSLTLSQMLFIIKKHYKLLVSVGILFLVLGFLVSKYLIHPKYEANVKFVVTAGPTSQTAILTYDQLSTAQQLLNTCAVVLKSNSTLEEVIYEYKIPLSVEQMEKCIEIKGIDETEVLSLTVSDTSAQRAADIANAIASIAPEKLVKTVKASSVEVISSAQVNGRPVSPNILLYTLVTFAFGIILGITASFLIEMLNDTFTTETSIERYLGIPVLGTIPHIKVK